MVHPRGVAEGDQTDQPQPSFPEGCLWQQRNPFGSPLVKSLPVEMSSVAASGARAENKNGIQIRFKLKRSSKKDYGLIHSV